MKVGIDWGGTKIEAIVLDSSTGKELLRKRVDACLLYTSDAADD